MDIVVSNPGERFLLSRMLNLADADYGDLVCRVYTNDYTPNRDTDLADLTPATWSGYTPTPLPPSSWSPPATVDGAAVSFFGPGPILFTALSSTTFAYGFYVTNGAGDVLVWSGRFDAAQLVNSSNPCVVSVALGDRSQSEPLPP